MNRRRLGVKIDHVATVRQVRRTLRPEPITAAALAELGGADQIIVHLREDRRHIQERDLKLLRETIQTALNVEMSATQEMLKVTYDTKPDIVTLVAERREERTTDGGLDVQHHRDHLRGYVQNLREADVTICCSVDPDLEQVRAAHRVGVGALELHTGKYCLVRGDSERRAELQRLVDAARAASKLGMKVAVGHGLRYENVRDFLPIEEVEEYNIGHAIVARAVLVGMERAVRDMVALLRS